MITDFISTRLFVPDTVRTILNASETNIALANKSRAIYYT